MKKEKFTEMIGEIDETFVAEVFEEKKPGRIIPFKKIIAVAACICLFAAMATVVIAEVFDIGFMKIFGSRDDITGKYEAEGYVLTLDIGKHSTDLVGAMEELRNGIDRQSTRIMYASEISDPVEREKFIERNGRSAVINVYGNHFYEKSFGNREAALEYIGFDGIKLPDTILDQERVLVTLYGYSGDELTELKIAVFDTHHGIDEPDISFYYKAKLYFDNAERTDTIQFLGDENETFIEERYTNENGNEYLVVKCMTAEGEIRRVNAFIIKDDILYEACMEVSWALKRVTENLEDYMDFIHDWANFY
ncbi:MAG: hypothetical protein IJO01_00140 [Oscillospiraceae bacterium]|nr:hypothetical protein [Oscillospiraceae bacterium]